MNKAIQKSAVVFAGLLVALTSGTPVLADDTELLLVSPNQAVTPQPNILFIIDSSGSMRSDENTREIYDSTTDYGGDCDDDMLYWSETGVVPACDNNNKFIRKDRFVCESAMLQLDGIGRYTNIMAQYRPSIFFFLGDRWNPLQAGNDDDIVECKKDSGIHGDGTAGELWARKGGNQNEFTNDSDLEVSWDSWPLSQNITVFDGNYLNYLENPVFVDKDRIDIVKEVTTTVLNSIENVNVGVMQFNDGDGGPVILGMTDLDTNRATVLAAVDGITACAGCVTPLSETLYEAARYWRGLPAYYGENIDEHPTDPNALVTPDPEVYKQPQTEVCAKNFNVLLTDGVPVSDQETPDLVDNLPNWFATHGFAGCDGAGDGLCLDDIASYLHKDDISLDPGPQLVTTHTIGFAIDLDILEEAALESEGTYFQADDVESLTIALLDIVSDIQDRSLSFAAPAVAVNTFNRTQNLNDLFLTTFAARETTHWPGNLKKYRILDGEIVDKFDVPAVNPADGFFLDSATSYWSDPMDGNDVEAGGALENLPDSGSRELYTNNGVQNNLTAGVNALSPGNANNFVNADFGLTGAAGEPSIEDLIRWSRGQDIRDEDDDNSTLDERDKYMGDPLHSQPAAVVYGGDVANPEAVVYTATNDGYLHAIDASTGVELWSFIPKELLPNLVSLYFNPDSQFKNYGLDGDVVPVVKDVDQDGVVDPGDGDFVVIIFGMRRGGGAYFAIDVTDKTTPILKWRVSEAGMDQSWSTPTVIRMDIDDNALNVDKAVVVVGGGYDAAHDTLPHPPSDDTSGNGIFFLDLQTGDVLWRAGIDAGAELTLPKMTRAFPNQIRAVDINGDRFADRMYASDVGGQLWRFDIFAGKQPNGIGADALVTGGVIAQLGAEGNLPATNEDTRRFYNAPDVSVFNDNAQSRRFVAISIGSGYRSHPLDNTNDDRFYSIRDKDVFNSLSQNDYDTYSIVKEDDLVEVSGSVGTPIGQADRGWKFTLPPNQKVLATSVTFNNEIFFVAFSPDTAAAATCGAGRGRNFLYRVSVINGDPVGDLDNIAAGDEDDARVTNLAQGGIAPSPRFVFPSPDDPDCEGDECSPPPLYCVGVECDDPGFDNNPVRTLWTQDGID